MCLQVLKKKELRNVQSKKWGVHIVLNNKLDDNYVVQLNLNLRAL